MRSWQKLRTLALGMVLGVSVTGWANPTQAEFSHRALPGLVLGQATTEPPKTEPDVPYVPTPIEVVQEMLKLAEVKTGDVIYDLGSGDGRLVIEAAQKFGVARGVGIEINPRLVKESTANATEAGVADRVRFFQQDLFQTDISDANVVTLYLLPRINIQLRPKLLNELKPGTRIVSHSFDMDDWRPDKTIVVNRPARQHVLYYWVIPAKVAGNWKGTLTTPSGDRQPYTLTLKQEFQQVQGVVDLNGQKFNFTGAKLNGNQIRFTNSRNFVGQRLNFQFDGQVKGDTINGVVEIRNGNGLMGKYNLTAQRG
jgi:SAM-dependent methyltransferase